MFVEVRHKLQQMKRKLPKTPKPQSDWLRILIWLRSLIYSLRIIRSINKRKCTGSIRDCCNCVSSGGRGCNPTWSTAPQLIVQPGHTVLMSIKHIKVSFSLRRYFAIGSASDSRSGGWEFDSLWPLWFLTILRNRPVSFFFNSLKAVLVCCLSFDSGH